MEDIVIDTVLRTEFGKQRAKAIRKLGYVPAIIYNRHHATIHISITLEGLKKILKTGPNELVTINIKNNDDITHRKTLIKNKQRHVVTNKLLHVDFYEVSEDEPIKMKAPLFAIGKAKGIELGGILQIVARELNIRALPAAIPKHIEVDVTELNIRHTLHVRDLKPIAGIEFMDDPDLPIVHIMAPIKETVAQPVAAEEQPAEPEVAKKETGEKEQKQPAGKSAPKEKAK